MPLFVENERRVHRSLDLRESIMLECFDRKKKRMSFYVKCHIL